MARIYNFVAMMGLLFAVNAYAGSIVFDGRFDSVSSSSNDASGKVASSAFQATRAKVDAQGILGTSNSARVRLDLNQAADATSKRDKTSKYVDFAFITHKFTDDFSLSAGKIISGMGGVEGSLSSGDLYLRSKVGDAVAAIYWPTGFCADLKSGDHNLKIAVGNNTSETLASGTLSQTSMLAGILYTSKLMDKTIQPNFSYYTEKFSTGPGVEKVSNVYAALGSRFLFGSDFVVEADYLANTNEPETSQKTETSSVVALVRYNINEFGSFHGKYEDSSAKAATTTKYKGMTFAAEYKPIADENWRMHLALTQRDETPEGAETKTDRIVYVGMRATIDLLK